MIPSCDGETVSECPLAGRLHDHGLTRAFRTRDTCMECTRQQDRWWNYSTALAVRRTQTLHSSWEKQATTMSSRTLASKTVLLWTLLLTMTLCYGVNAAPEAFHRRQGDGSLVFSHPDLPDLKDHDLAENIVQDPKHQEELAALIDWLQQVQQWQQQGTEDDRNGLESGVIPPSEGYPNLPIPLPLIAKYFRSQDGVSKEDVKRGSYMSLCHFKICNMGRKRNLRWNPWLRR